MPRIAVPLSDGELETDGARVQPLADVIELRIDRFARRDAAHVARTAATARRLARPLIATVRAAAEGGEAACDEGERLALYEAALPAVEAVDVELAAPIRNAVVARARAEGRTVILSFHDFTATPPTEALLAKIDAAEAAGADIVKLAPTPQSAADAARLLDLLRRRCHRPLICFGLGPYGTMSRVFFPLVGSLLTYGFARDAVAPGQLSADVLARELARYSPDYARAHPMVATDPEAP